MFTKRPWNITMSTIRSGARMPTMRRPSYRRMTCFPSFCTVSSRANWRLRTDSYTSSSTFCPKTRRRWARAHSHSLPSKRRRSTFPIQSPPLSDSTTASRTNEMSIHNQPAPAPCCNVLIFLCRIECPYLMIPSFFYAPFCLFDILCSVYILRTATPFLDCHHNEGRSTNDQMQCNSNRTVLNISS